MRRPFALLVMSLFALSLLASSNLSVAAVSAATIAPTTTCSNGVDDTPGLGLICEVTIVNHLTASGGTSTVTIRECHGAAGDPTAACTTTTDTVGSPVTQVTQCNAATNGGGATLRCSVSVTNAFVGVSPGQTGVTINQCVGSADGIANDCDPFPAAVVGAAITQCNGSANGGTLVGLTCTATGESADAFTVRINQCNGSANGGGSLVICSASIRNTFAALPTPTPAPTAVATATPAPTAAPTATPTAAPTGGAAGVPTAAPSQAVVIERIVANQRIPTSSPAVVTPNERVVVAGPSGPTATGPATDVASQALGVATSAPGVLSIGGALLIFGLVLTAVLTGRGWRPDRSGTPKG